MSLIPTITDDVKLFRLKGFIDKLKPSQIVVVCDKGSKKYCYPALKDELGVHNVITISGGEANKNLATCEKIWSFLEAKKYNRNVLLIALGGGLVTDLVGFAAATYKRGVKCIYISTTLMGIVDAAAGGKTGVNFHHHKNMIGLFKEPLAIFHSTQFLETLPEKERLSGWAEVIKHCLIADSAKWQELRTMELEDVNWLEVIQHSIAVKNSFVEADPEEKGIRKALNFGHTVGHAIESFLMDSKRQIPHGYAVAAGIVVESYLSFKKKLISLEELENIEEYIFSIYGKVRLKESEIDSLVLYARNDKKNSSSKINFTLLDGIGNVKIDQEFGVKDFEEGMRYYITGSAVD